jgi:hypothetical protein
MNVAVRCECGHYRAVHWRYGLMEGCSQRESGHQCRCRGFSAMTGSLEAGKAELLACVARCEHDWALMDRIDLSLGLAVRRAAPRQVAR